MPDYIETLSAKQEIKGTMKWSNLCNTGLGVDYYDEDRGWPLYSRYFVRFYPVFTMLSIALLIVGESLYISAKMSENFKVEDVIVVLHLWGYALMSLCKIYVIWMKKAALKRILTELETVWPSASSDQAEVDIKNISYKKACSIHAYYFWFNLAGLLSYATRPILTFIFKRVQGYDDALQMIWSVSYPYDINAPVARALSYFWEAYVGFLSVGAMTGSDLLFAAVAGNIAMLLRILNLRLCSLAPRERDSTDAADLRPKDHNSEIVQLVKFHIKLLRLSDEIESIFTVPFLANIMLSSINICCAGFIAVLLEPISDTSAKMFLVSALYQIGVVCWCGDDIYQVSGEVCLAAYSGGWYRCDLRCRRLLAILMLRSQKPIAFTAMNFKYLNLVTFSGILTNSYSYFTLLYTMYTK